MRAKAGIFIIIILLFLVGTVSAAGPFNVAVISSKAYLTAGYTNNLAIISVNVKNINTSLPVAGARVTFSVDDPSLGVFQFNSSVTTDVSGNVNNTFISNTKSGFANILVTATDPTDSTAFTTQVFVQKIDHDNVRITKFDHAYEGAVGTIVPVNISFTDRWGNPIDRVINPGKLHTINLHVTGPNPYDCIFVGYGPDISGLALDTNGNVSVNVRLTSGAGPNVVTLDPIEDVPVTTRYITGVSSEPFSIQQVFNPDSPSQIPANGVDKFTILYSLFDKYGNPANQQWVWVNTTVLGEEQKFKTDNLGQIAITYGPRVSVGIINITAVSVVNNTVAISHEVEFTNTAATTMVLTANPEVMASRDVNAGITSDIIASVTDIMGNPVENETVTLSLGTAGYPGGPYNITSGPSLTGSSASTDSNGRAIVQFIPGSFSTNTHALNYSATSTGTCVVTAHWNTTDKNILVTWKNYPYLSVETGVNPNPVTVNDTVDVTILLKGDGWALQPKPIDVMFSTDRSGSMMDDNPDRMVSIMAAAKTFVDEMSANDQLGQVSFGQKGTAEAITYTPSGGSQLGPGSDGSTSDDAAYRTAHYPASPKDYNDYATLDLPLSFDKTQVKATIDRIVPYSGTPMRSAIYKSVNEINTHGRSTAIKAIILLSDGDYNWYGDPLARGTGHADSSGYRADDYGDLDTDYMTFTGLGSGKFSEQNMSVYAKNHGIKIYSIAFGNTITSGGRTTLSILANATGGKYYVASATDITSVYTSIAGDLKDTAGVNATMVTDFQNINVTGVSLPGAQVYDYIYNSTASTKIGWQNGVTNVTNQTTDWISDNKLDFTIGTIKVGQQWNATFRLKVKKPGNVDLFGPGSSLIFNNGTEILNLPHTYFNAISAFNVTGFELQQIDIVSSCPVQAPDSPIIPITWDVIYTGGETDIYEVVNYIDESGAHIPFHHGGFHVMGSANTTRNAQFDMRTVHAGSYSIEVRTYTSSNAASTSIPCGSYQYSTKGTTFIKLN
jgi:hypothetical protein